MSGLPWPVFVLVFMCVFAFVIVIVIVKWKSVSQWVAILCLLQALQVVSQVHTCRVETSKKMSTSGLPSPIFVLVSMCVFVIFIALSLSLSLSLSSGKLSTSGLPAYFSKNLMSRGGIAQPLLQLGIQKRNGKAAQHKIHYGIYLLTFRTNWYLMYISYTML